MGPGPGPGPGPRLEAGSRGRVGSGSEVGVGSEVGTEAGRRVRSGFGSKATFSELWHSEMRFFKTHGFHKPLLREMLFRVQFISGVLLGLLLLENPIEV